MQLHSFLKRKSTSTKAKAATLAVSTTARTSAPSGALVVSTSPASGQFATIAAAIKSLGSSTKAASIFVEAGTYSGSVYITYGGKLTIYGYTSDTSSYAGNKVTLTNDGSKSTDGNDDASGTLRVHSNGFTMYNINVVNSYGLQAEQSQALALSAYGTEQGYYGCSFVGYQDTVLTDTGTQVFAKSYIEGAVDYIFGQTANTWLDHCTIASKAAGTITASGRPSSTSTGIYVFNSCTIEQASSATSSLSGLVYLGRPWTEYARAVFMFSSLSDIIASKGWEEWSSTEPNTSGVTFAEYSNSGVGSSTTSRATFATQLTSTTVASYTLSKILGTDYADWVDTSYL
ncbi:pectinesterase, partial [Phenoliferia sp. Uapishka_3]